MKIEELGLSTWAYHPLKRAGINTVGQLRRLHDVELMAIRGFGASSLEEVHSKLVDCPATTNGEWLREMSDPELADLLLSFSDLDEKIGFCKADPKCEALMEREEEIPPAWCKACVVKWLRSPAEEERG